MTTKRVQYVPAVETPADLPAPSGFATGVAFYVESEQAFVATNGTQWTIITGPNEGTVVAP